MATQSNITKVDGSSFAVRCAGARDRPAFVFLHGWPESSRTFLPLMRMLADEFYLLAIDLPGVGGSKGALPIGDTHLLARMVRKVIEKQGAKSVILVGHDYGGMIAFSYARQFGSELDGIVIANTVIPGVPPWEKIIANPQIWHFAFHAVPRLPATLVAGHQREYFDYFFNAIAYNKSALTEELRDAYASDYGSVDALQAGFLWYAALAKDAKLNQRHIDVNTPTLYVRGANEIGNIDEYVEGLQASGFHTLTSHVIPNCGHFSVDEAPERFVAMLRDFREKCDLLLESAATI